ncbi:coiled-coil domain-containing protein 60 [Pipistrellus kuhlii]|uniref:Coiled-coil domain containing 60 n=1 Tax=Pipistrellus kuhlii TaxID=59472 RepID=A0A7J7UFU6_PIPKU|nr:coiled-coil domain-containing protein 60 [Pipistrellus kuhlii]KAF6311636.1 coiled-coil domain containing 60 [Pipistrellus kuhlii]
MTKTPAPKKIQSSPNSGALRTLNASDPPAQVPEKPEKSIKYMEKEIVNLKKDLMRSRYLIRSVMIGRGYFSMLREESTLKKRQQKLQKLKDEEEHRFQPAKKISDILSRDTVLTTFEDEKLKKAEAELISRPFTPKYSCIISPLLPESHVEPLFRQLCALHWLLEALTIDHAHHTMKPLITCWNTKDPGGSKSTIKKITKDKSMGQRWEHFLAAPKTKKFKTPTQRTTSRKPSRRGSVLSLSRASAGSSPLSSMISMNPGSDEPPSVTVQAGGNKDIEDTESSSTRPDEDLHISLQKLLEMVREEARRTIMMESEEQKKAPSISSMLKQTKSDSAYKDMQLTLKSSDRSSSTSGETHSQPIQKKSKSRTYQDLINCKTNVCSTMRAKFYNVAQEAGFCLQDKMEILMKRQEERGLQKFHSFVLVSNFQKDIAKMRHKVAMVKGDAEEIADHWYFDLLSKLPEDLKSFRPAKKILAKLQKFGENLDLRIRPHVLLKVLQELRTWELCSPDVAVAVEFVREHIIHMPQEDYINWLQTRINIPTRPQTART